MSIETITEHTLIQSHHPTQNHLQTHQGNDAHTQTQRRTHYVNTGKAYLYFTKNLFSAILYWKILPTVGKRINKKYPMFPFALSSSSWLFSENNNTLNKPFHKMMYLSWHHVPQNMLPHRSYSAPDPPESFIQPNINTVLLPVFTISYLLFPNEPRRLNIWSLLSSVLQTDLLSKERLNSPMKGLWIIAPCSLCLDLSTCLCSQCSVFMWFRTRRSSDLAKIGN